MAREEGAAACTIFSSTYLLIGYYQGWIVRYFYDIELDVERSFVKNNRLFALFGHLSKIPTDKQLHYSFMLFWSMLILTLV